MFLYLLKAKKNKIKKINKGNHLLMEKIITLEINQIK